MLKQYSHLNLVIASISAALVLSSCCSTTVNHQKTITQGDNAADAIFNQQLLFTAGEGGYTTFRIPAIVKVTKGELLAFCEGRGDDGHDYGNIDIVLKRSKDSGKTWSPLEVVVDNASAQAGNPTPLVDWQDPLYRQGRLFLHYNTASNSERDIVNGVGVREVWYKTSLDNGVSWSKAVNITTSVHRPHEPSVNPDYNFREDWRWYANGPVHGIQLKSGRMLIPGNHTYGHDHENDFSHVYYSDDHGLSWHMGGIAGKNTNEASIVELANGDVLMNMRRIHHVPKPYRGIAISKDGGLNFGPTISDPTLVEPQVQASILRYTLAEQHGKNRLLFSNPKSKSKRENMTVRLSYDEGKTWTQGRSLYSGSSAYSDLVVLNDMSIGALHEADNYQKIYFSQFNLSWLSYGKDAL